MSTLDNNIFSASSSSLSLNSLLPPPQVFGTAMLYQSLLSEQCRDKGIICKLYLESTSKTSSPSSSFGCFFDSTDESCCCPYSHISDGEMLVIPNSMCRFSSTNGRRCLGQKCTFFHGTKEQFEELKRKKRQKAKLSKNKNISPSKSDPSLSSFSTSSQLGLSLSMETTLSEIIMSSDESGFPKVSKDNKNCSNNCNTNDAMMYRPQDYLPIMAPPEELKLCNIESFLTIVKQMHNDYTNNIKSMQELSEKISSFTKLQMQLYFLIQEQHRLNSLVLERSNNNSILSENNYDLNNNAYAISTISANNINVPSDVIFLNAPVIIGSDDFFSTPYVTNVNDYNAFQYQLAFLNQNQPQQHQLQQQHQAQRPQQLQDQFMQQPLLLQQPLQYNQYIPQVQLQQSMSPALMQNEQLVQQQLNFALLLTDPATKMPNFFESPLAYRTYNNISDKICDTINNNIELNDFNRSVDMSMLSLSNGFHSDEKS